MVVSEEKKSLKYVKYFYYRLFKVFPMQYLIGLFIILQNHNYMEFIWKISAEN